MIPGTYNSITKQAAGVITFIGNAGKNVDTGGQTITYHASSASGDLLLLIVQADDGDSIGTPSGWTSLTNRSYSPYCRGKVMYKFKGTDTSVYVSDVGDHQCSSVLTFRNVDSSLTAGTAAGGTLSATNSETIPGVTTTADGAFVIWIGFHDAPSNSSQASGWTNANITGGAELADFSTDTSWDGGFAVWGGIKTTAGATGNTTLTWDAGVGGIIYYTLPLMPA